MYSEFRLYVGECPLKQVVGIRKSEFRSIVERPQVWHIAFEALVCASQPSVGVSLLAGRFVHAALREKVIPSLMPLVESADEALLVGVCHCLRQFKQFYIDASSSGFDVRYVRTMRCWCTWHI